MSGNIQPQCNCCFVSVDELWVYHKTLETKLWRKSWTCVKESPLENRWTYCVEIEKKLKIVHEKAIYQVQFDISIEQFEIVSINVHITFSNTSTIFPIYSELNSLNQKLELTRYICCLSNCYFVREITTLNFIPLLPISHYHYAPAPEFRVKYLLHSMFVLKLLTNQQSINSSKNRAWKFVGKKC